MINLFWDIDGTIRRLDKPTIGEELPYWNYKKNGVGFCTLVDNNLTILEKAQPYSYLNVLNKQKNAVVITHQPEKWKPYTERWLSKWVKIPYEIIYVDCIEDKLEYLENNDYLIDDYPLFSSYDNILLVDRLWNQEVKAINRIFGTKDLREFLSR